MEFENYLIRAEVTLPIVEKYFDRILPAQWSMLAAGTIDSATQVTLADMCMEITQKLCADTFRLIIPQLKQRTQSGGKKRMKLKVEGGLSTAFASALSVPEQPSIHGQKLDSLLKKEISQRVNETLSAATSSDSQLVPLLYIPGTFTQIEVLAKMVLLACGALKVYLSKMAIYTQCFRPCRRQMRSQEFLNGAKCGNKCTLNQEETREAVIKILRKWTDSEDVSLSLRTSRELKKTAASVAETIINLDYADPTEGSHSRSSTPHFNLGFIKDHLCEFFESQTSSNESSRKPKFLNFCQKMLDVLTSELQKVRCLCMRMRWETDIPLPGSVPQILKPDADTLLSLKGFQSGLEDVFHKVPIPVADSSIDVDKLRHKADTFSQEMEDKIYRYMTTNRTTVESAEVWKRFSESLILEVEGEKPDNIQVLRKIVEDRTTKFVQQLLLWLKMEAVTRRNHADEVYGCLNDIDTLVAGTMIPQKIPIVCLPDRDDFWPKTPPANEESDKHSFPQYYAWASLNQPSSMQEVVTTVPMTTQKPQEFKLDEIQLVPSWPQMGNPSPAFPCPAFNDE